MSTSPDAGAICRPYGALASLGWGVIALGVWLGTQVVIGDFLAEWFDTDASDPASLASNAPFVALITIGSAVVPLAVIAAAIRLRRCGVAEYLRLVAPASPDVFAGVVALAVLIPVVDAISWFAGQAVTPQFVLSLYSSARDAGALLLLAVALVVAAPVVEETIFRGFLLPGFAASPIGEWGALLATSLLWALLHAQYQPFYLAQIVVLGLLFGWLRLRSGSTLLTIGLHGAVNLVSLVQAAVIVEWLS
ncbi:MAG: CPBP family intramembrane metalloprotease [Bradyrhizobiaceae bacterium]|nr:CPBP family intramembrane metalloprotease [Bradyrhizobiaceae bacterium]